MTIPIIGEREAEECETAGAENTSGHTQFPSGQNAIFLGFAILELALALLCTSCAYSIYKKWSS